MTVVGAEKFVPDSRSLRTLSAAAADCRGCSLYRAAEQTVFGEGSKTAELMLVGEQPGDSEDRAGEPFVGPAGKLLHRALDDAGIEATNTYVTNAVKHFKFVPAERGKRRIHQKPGRTEIVACRPWLLAELAAVQPTVVVCLGATAAQSLLGWDFRVTAHRSEAMRFGPDLEMAGDPIVFATVHPSSLLRGPAEQRDTAYSAFVHDLQVAVAAV